ncbi:uncharacterized protein LOC130383066 [Gadus chalcogrammus]|uniref:uncharacterized protein LOC130383066 n=1 Tax=Gadus chalcogrammus TaxID=1042646 RepID=UPI0024C432E3|nr:uncharacterized protein LOC130383066 [Gadus chalcogrammus]
MGNYRTKLRGLGCPELDVNLTANKRPNERAPAKNIKKPRRAEINYLPPLPKGETKGSLESERVELLTEIQKRNNNVIIAEKMAKTFSIQRDEIVNQTPQISEVKDRWPALFEATQINEEFQRLTMVTLEPTFMAKLDQHTPKILSLMASRGGAAKPKIHLIQNMLLQEEASSIEKKREAAIRGLILYLGEKDDDLIKDELDVDDDSAEVIKIITTRSDPPRARVVIEGTSVLEDIDVPRACALLMGLIYALNLSYPKNLRNTFEVFQKIFLELDSLKASHKVMSLKSKLLI